MKLRRFSNEQGRHRLFSGGLFLQIEDMKNGEFSDEDFNNAKTTIIATIDFIPDEQDTQISYYFGGEFTGKVVSIDEYKNIIQNITKDQVIELAKNVKLHTTYFLKGKEE